MKRPEIPADGVNRVTLEVEEGYSAQQRLDQLVVSRLPKISRNRVQKLIADGSITVNGNPSKASAIVPGGSIIEVVFPHPPRPPAAPEDIPLEIVFEDEHLLVIDKPAGMVVHPAAGHSSGTLVNALLGRYQNLPNPGGPTMRPGIVHRLDKDTSGLIVIAKSDEVMTTLGRRFHDHDIEREYAAVVWGDPPDKGTINAPLLRHPGNRKKYAVVEGGKRAITHWKVRERYGFASLVALRLETGRTHQIRVHMAHKGWSVFGDSTYGGRMHGLARMTSFQRTIAREALDLMPRQALHARLLGFEHPVSKEMVRFEGDLPEDMATLVEYLRENML
ncbi:RluA family pseudouridine synthase [bacterium]|nr:RluA family pseudouridine synthase [bacterium]